MNDCAQDMHVDLMHVLYVYSRVMRGGVITKYSGGAGTCIMWYPKTSIKHMQCCDNRVHVDMYIYGVQGYIYIYIYIYV